jgi:hypothetical protein
MLIYNSIFKLVFYVYVCLFVSFSVFDVMTGFRVREAELLVLKKHKIKSHIFTFHHKNGGVAKLG